jgi:hypothetical protein
MAERRVNRIQDAPLQNDIASSLISVGTQILSMILSPQALALHRLVVSEVARVQANVGTFCENGPDKTYHVVAKILQWHADRGDIVVADPNTTARIFVDALTGDLQLRSLLGEHIDQSQIETKVHEVVDHLLNGLRR